MAHKNKEYITVNSVSELHQMLSLPKPTYPLVSLIRLEDVKNTTPETWNHVVLNFYNLTVKKCVGAKVKYGQNYYDFDEGMMTFISPGQVTSVESDEIIDVKGWWLIFHPDFIRHYPLGRKIKEYGFFSYAVNEALHLSDKEEAMIEGIMANILQEYQSGIDTYSQDVLVAQIDLLLSYANRFYNRQLITRKHVHRDVLTKLEGLLSDYFDSGKVQELGLPTVQYISDQFHVSPNYLSDMLRSLTGQSTQQHIHDKLIEKAKESLTTTSLSVSEIAYQLGFDYPQSFSKLFKNKTQVSPLAYRNSFN